MKKKYPTLASNDACTGCLTCIDACKKGALDTVKKHGLRYVILNKSLCVQCGACENSCTVFNSVRGNKLKEIQPFEGWITNDNLRLKSASGGAFTSFALEIFRRKGVVIGASLIGNEVFHVDIQWPADLSKLQNSKYLQSNTVGIYRKTLDFLKLDKWVLFSGTSCQIAGLNAFLSEFPHLIRKLITVDILCHGVPSDEALTYHLIKNKSPKIISFRDKSNGWWGVKSQNTTIALGDNNNLTKRFDKASDLFYRDFRCGLSSRLSCCDCKYSALPRYADITIGDYWGTKCNVEEQFKGVSIILANNMKGIEFIKSDSNLYLKKISMVSAMRSNPRIYTGYSFVKFHPIMMFRNLLYKILPYELRHDILINKMPWKVIWGIYRLITKIHERVEFKKNLRQYNRSIL